MTARVWLVWGLGATIVLTTLLAGSQGLGFTRMSLPTLLGMMLTPDRDRARAVGFLVHLVNGLVFSLLYFAAFALIGSAGAGLGALLGLAHGLFVAAVVLPILPAFHPQIARPQAGPTTERRLEPPGFLGKNYGWSTSIVVVLAHVVFGALLGLGASLAR